MKRTTAVLVGLVAGLVPVATANAAVAHGAKVNTLTLTMTGNKIKVSGAEKSGAVTVVSKVTPKGGATPTLIKLKPGVTFAKLFRGQRGHASDPNYVDPYGQIVSSTTAPKGTSSTQTVLSPGNWVAIDTTKNNPAKWPHKTFTVTRAGHLAKLAKPGAVVKTIEFAFTGPSTWHNGEVIRFENAGFLVHMVLGIRVSSPAEAATVTTLLQQGKDSQAQALATGFISPVGVFSPGGLVQEKVQAAPGTYVLACFMDTQDGREHTQLGMERTITITP